MPVGGLIIHEVLEEIKKDILNEIVKIWNNNTDKKLSEILKICGYDELKLQEDISFDGFDKEKFMNNKEFEKFAITLI